MDILLWIDDERQAPKSFTHTVKTSREAIEFLSNLPEEDDLVLVSFDHDLGGEFPYDDSRPVVKWMLEHRVLPEEVHVHSVNSIGARWIQDSFLDIDIIARWFPYNPRNYQ